MKKVLVIICLFYVTVMLNAQNLTHQEMLEFYPDNSGNRWSYWWILHDPVTDYTEAGKDEVYISRDTTINSEKYWSIEFNYGSWSHENYFERIDTVTGNVFRINKISINQINCVDNVYAEIGDTVSISNNKYLLYCDKLVVVSIYDTVINNFETTIREVLGLPHRNRLFFARNIGMLGSGQNYWLDSASVNGSLFHDISYDITDVITDKKQIIKNFMLYQNYPNPFNPATIIEYSLPALETGHAPSLHVTLVVYDILGRQVALLVNEKQKPGNYEVVFNAGYLSSGIYFYQLLTKNNLITKKCMLIK